jgi:hypothetical protein
LTSNQIARTEAGHAVGSPTTYLQAARDVGRLKDTPGYLGIGEIRDEATVADRSARRWKTH